MNRLTIRLIIAALAILTTVSFINHAEAQTPPTPQSFATSSSYITGASGRDYITPFAGFGVSMLPDSCSSYANIASDTTKITYLLTTQIKDMMTMYNNASCNTETTPSPTCTSYIDTINNLAISYATYQVEGMKQAKEKTSICNADNTRKPNVYKKTYYGIDIVALTYASVRDAYVNKKFTDYTTLINNVKTNLTNKLNAAITADRFVDATPSSANLRTLAQSTFKTTSKVVVPRTRVVPPPASTVLSMPNAFLFFGQTNNVSDKTLGIILFNSLQEFANTLDSNPTRLGDIYSASNRSLLAAGSDVLVNINRQINLRLPPMDDMGGNIAPTSTPPIVQQQPPTQKASVINSIGNWFGSIWTTISDFFAYIFWGERAGARVAATASGMGASGSGMDYQRLCPGFPKEGARAFYATFEDVYKSSEFKNIQKTLPLEAQEKLNDPTVGAFHVFAKNLFVVRKESKDVLWWASTTNSGIMPRLSVLEMEYVRNIYYVSSNENNVRLNPYTAKEVPPATDEEINAKRSSRVASTYSKYHQGRQYFDDFSEPYDCLRAFDFYIIFDHVAMNSDSIKIDVSARANYSGSLIQQAMTMTYDTSERRRRMVLDKYAIIKTRADNLKAWFKNRPTFPNP